MNTRKTNSVYLPVILLLGALLLGSFMVWLGSQLGGSFIPTGNQSSPNPVSSPQSAPSNNNSSNGFDFK